MLRLEVLRQRIHRLPSNRVGRAPIQAHGLPAGADTTATAATAAGRRGDLVPFAQQMQQQVLRAARLVEIQILVQVPQARYPRNIPAGFAEGSFHARTSPRRRQVHIFRVDGRLPTDPLAVELLLHRSADRCSFEGIFPRVPASLGRVAVADARSSQGHEHVTEIRVEIVSVEATAAVKGRSVELSLPRDAGQFLRDLIGLLIDVRCGHFDTALRADIAIIRDVDGPLDRSLRFRCACIISLVHLRPHGDRSQVLGQLDDLLSQGDLAGGIATVSRGCTLGSSPFQGQAETWHGQQVAGIISRGGVHHPLRLRAAAAKAVAGRGTVTPQGHGFVAIAKRVPRQRVIRVDRVRAVWMFPPALDEQSEIVLGHVQLLSAVIVDDTDDGTILDKGRTSGRR